MRYVDELTKHPPAPLAATQRLAVVAWGQLELRGGTARHLSNHDSPSFYLSLRRPCHTGKDPILVGRTDGLISQLPQDYSSLPP